MTLPKHRNPTRFVAAIAAVALATAACGDSGDTAKAASTASVTAPVTAAPTSTIALTSTKPAPTTVNVATAAAKFTMAAADFGPGYAPAPNPSDPASPASQGLFKAIRADAGCSAIADAFPPDGAAATELKFNGYFASASGQSFAVGLWAAGEANAKRTVELNGTQAQLITQCLQKAVRALLPDITYTVAPQPLPSGLTVQGTAHYAKNTTESTIAKIKRDGLSFVVANGPFLLEVTHGGSPGTLKEGDFVQVAKVANQRLSDALR